MGPAALKCSPSPQAKGTHSHGGVGVCTVAKGRGSGRGAQTLGGARQPGSHDPVRP